MILEKPKRVASGKLKEKEKEGLETIMADLNPLISLYRHLAKDTCEKEKEEFDDQSNIVI